MRTRHAQQVSVHVRAGGVRHTVLVQVRARARVRVGFSKRLRRKSCRRRHQTLGVRFRRKFVLGEWRYDGVIVVRNFSGINCRTCPHSLPPFGTHRNRKSYRRRFYRKQPQNPLLGPLLRSTMHIENTKLYHKYLLVPLWGPSGDGCENIKH